MTQAPQPSAPAATEAWLAEAARLSINSEVIDPDTGYIRFSRGERSLTILIRPSKDRDTVVFGCNNMFVGFFLRSPERVGVVLDAVGIPHGMSSTFRVGRVGQGTIKELNVFVRERMPVQIEAHGRRFRRVVSERNRHVVLTELLSGRIHRLGARRFFPVSRQLLVVNGVVIGASDYSVLRLVGDGRSDVGDLARETVFRELCDDSERRRHAVAEHGAAMARSLGLETPCDGELVEIRHPVTPECRENQPAFGERFAAMSRKVVEALGPGVCVLTVGRDTAGEWIVTDVRTRDIFNEFADYHVAGRGPLIRRLLETFFNTDPPHHVLPRVENDRPAVPTNEQWLEYRRAAGHIGLDCELPDSLNNVVRVKGKDKQLYVHAVRYAELSCNAATAVTFSSSKERCHRLFRRHDIPAPAFRAFDNTAQLPEGPDETVESEILAYAADRYPVVVKPAQASRSIGVTLNVRGETELRRAVRKACVSESKRILVEDHIESDDNPVPGTNYRISVCRGKVIRIGSRTPPYVIGDGRSTCMDLIEKENTARREAGHNPIGLEPDGPTLEQLERMGLELDDIPEPGRFISLFQPLLTGQTTAVEPSRFHPDNLAMFGRAAEVIGLEWVGMDFITPHPDRSYREVRCAITDVNARPGIPPGNTDTYVEPLLRAYFDIT